MKLIPLNNNLLIEVIREDDGVSRTDENENKQVGILRAVSVSEYHLTASAALMLDGSFRESLHDKLKSLVGSRVMWEQLAEAGQTFERDGKTYALVPWWRVLSYEDEEGEPDGK